MYLILWKEKSGTEHWKQYESADDVADYLERHGLYQNPDDVFVYETVKSTRIPLFTEKEREMAKTIMNMLAYANPNTKVWWNSQLPVLEIEPSLFSNGRKETCALRANIFPSLSQTARKMTLCEIANGGIVPYGKDDEEEE